MSSFRGPSSEASSIRSISPGPNPGLRGTRSFSRLETGNANVDPLTSSLARLGTGSVPEKSTVDGVNDESEDDDATSPAPLELPEGFDELPPELITLADRFVDSLTKPVLPAPLSISELSILFQQFYGTASQAIVGYVSHSYQSLKSKRGVKKTPTQMLSKAEMSQKRKDRKLLEVKRIAFEEKTERRVTEALYDKLWRHKSTDDEARDDSLNSKIAALKVVGVKLGHLGVELDSPEKKEAMDQDLKEAVQSLIDMNEKTFPLGKLTLLKKAHKIIVDSLTKHVAATSADSLLPALIYTLIITPPTPPLNAISNLVFTQRFRASNFIDGEAAYCLTNFEAAISFLETVDLATLGVSDTSGAGTPIAKTPDIPSQPWVPADDPLSHLSTKLSQAHVAATVTANDSAVGKNAIHDSSRDRSKLTFLTPIDLAHTAAQTAVETADQGIRGIGTALEGSFRFLFDRGGDNVPRTLEDARKLVESPNPAIGALQREDSTDSMTQLAKTSAAAHDVSPAPTRPAAPHHHSLDPLKTIGSSIGRFANIGMRPFARTPVSSMPATPVTPQPVVEKVHTKKVDSSGGEGVKDLLSTFPDLAKELPVIEKLKFDERFVNVKDADELRIAEVPELLSEYQRLIAELKKRGLA